MTPERTTFLGRDGNRIVADSAGDPADPPVLLLHGGGQTRHSWGTTVTILAAHGWRAHSADLRGHGDSDWAPDGDYTLDAFAGDVVAIGRSLGRPPALVGASLGGIASLTAVGEHAGDDLARARWCSSTSRPASRRPDATASASS
jgi:pimeloyl-ACP methyl ester carboxylesterase